MKPDETYADREKYLWDLFDQANTLKHHITRQARVKLIKLVFNLSSIVKIILSVCDIFHVTDATWFALIECLSEKYFEPSFSVMT